MKRIPAVMAAAVLALDVSTATAQLGPKDGAGLSPTDLERVKVGDTAPDFSLRSRDGDVITLSSFRGKKAVVLVFYRGHW
jgi:cytochrome oxidase Cu insertion factor (SCO1/SenC/PrrC family)